MNKFIGFLIFILFVLSLSYGTTVYLERDLTITVQDKERIGITSGDGTKYKYLVYGKHETFENTDSFWYLKYTSSDLQNDLKMGHTYNVKVTGLRVPFLSWHRNIIQINNQ